MSNELVKPDFSQLPTSPMNPDEFKSLSDAKKYLQRIQLYTKGQAIDTGKIGPGQYGIPDGEDIESLGNEIDVLVFAVRAKAMDVSDPEDIRVSYSQKEPLYAEIVEGGGLFGPSFLVYERTKNEFFEMFFCNKSARKVATTLYPFAPMGAEQAEQCGVEAHGPLAATLGVRYAKNKKGSWHVTTVKECKVPFTQEPDYEAAVKEVNKFYNPEAEEAGEEDTRGRTR